MNNNDKAKKKIYIFKLSKTNLLSKFLFFVTKLGVDGSQNLSIFCTGNSLAVNFHFKVGI